MKKLLNSKNEIEQVLLGFKRTFYTVGIFSAITNLLALTPSLYMLQVYDRVLATIASRPPKPRSPRLTWAQAATP